MGREIIERLARIEEKIDDLRETKLDHESRLRKVEAFRNWFMGLSCVSAVIGVVSWFGSNFRGHH